VDGKSQWWVPENLEGGKMLDTEKNGAGSETKEEIQFTQELKLADKLAVERTVMAADWTMLAGVRTSMALIGFGFTIFNILKYVQEHAPIKVMMRPQTPRNIGAFLLVVGIVPLLALIIQYSRTLKRMGSKENLISNPNFQMAVAVLSLRTILLVTLIGNILLL
jgi:putative membrane protein